MVSAGALGAILCHVERVSSSLRRRGREGQRTKEIPEDTGSPLKAAFPSGSAQHKLTHLPSSLTQLELLDCYPSLMENRSNL